MIRYKVLSFDMREVFADEPRHRVPRAAFSLTRKALDTAGLADVLVTKSDKLFAWPYLDPKEFTFAGRAWLLPSATLRLGSSALRMRLRWSGPAAR